MRHDTPGATVRRAPWASGLLAARPAANTVPARYEYLATDDNGGTWWKSDGTNWIRLGGSVVLGRKEMTAVQGTITAEAIITDLAAFSVTCRGLPYEVQAHIPSLANDTATNAINARLRDITGLTTPTASQGTVLDLQTIEAPRAGGGGGCNLRGYVAAAAVGTVRTFRPTAARVTAGTVTANADSGALYGKGFIQAVEL